jgi:hypothetical protein
MKNLLFILFLFHCFFGFSQNNKIKTLKSESFLVTATAFVGYDALGALYYINDNAFFKQKNGKILDYRNPSLGKISKVDLQNPLKIVLFYENFNTIITLDNELNETQKINFSENKTPINVLAMGIASGNRFWIYNSYDNQIGLFDYLKNDYKTISLPISGNIKYYESDFNNFYWIDEKNKLSSIDVYGKVTSWSKVPDFDVFEMISKEAAIFQKNNLLYYLSIIDNKTTLIDLEEKTFENFGYREQILSIFTTQEITNYKIILP